MFGHYSLVLVGGFAAGGSKTAHAEVLRQDPAPAQAQVRSFPRLASVSSFERLVTWGQDGVLSMRNQDRLRARRAFPFEMEVHLVRLHQGTSAFQAIGSDNDRVWLVDVERKIAQAHSLGRLVVPEDDERALVERAVCGGRLVIAYAPGAGSWHGAGGAPERLFNVLVRSDESLFQVRFDGSESPAVTRIGDLSR